MDEAIPEQRQGDSGGDEFPELTQLGWFTHLEQLTATSFFRMSVRLPSMVSQALRLSWRAAPGLTLATIALNFAAGIGTVVSLLTVFDVAATLFEQAPTIERVRAAVPGLVLLGVVLAGRSGLGIAAGWAQARLTPLVGRQVHEDFYALTTAVPLVTFDDSDFADEMERSTNRGMDAGPEVVSDSVDVLTGLIGIVAVAAAVAIVHPLLLVFVVVAVLPVGWAAVRSARIGYESLRARIARRRKAWSSPR